MAEKGIFISFEGPDGAGKTTVMTAVADYFKQKLGVDQVLETREPGGTRISEQIRDVLFDDQNTNMDPRTEALLFAAARRQLVVQKLKPFLAAGKLILADRYVDSSVAYQGAGRHLGVDQIWDLNQYAIDGCLPQLTIYLDLPVQVGIERITKFRADQVNRLDKETLTFHEAVHQAFDQLATRHPQRIVKIDATQPKEKVIQTVLKTINDRFF
ncbi:dTMP kinase [Lactobacillus sp. 3B(2020)]|uniref:dTMP kinase n=1 Tax=Lactobacillus sp. 3B(2020) TaxID=2695882 RepID=UPI0015DE003D|nr:dTMP kinase [Lactobacillus sp. 3B(2020)]QLL70590.1 dTMP kinase [Lactobacillus sp. 3B(2020)]